MNLSNFQFEKIFFRNHQYNTSGNLACLQNQLRVLGGGGGNERVKVGFRKKRRRRWGWGVMRI